MRREALVVAIRAAQAEVRSRHGSPRIRAGLAARGRARCVNTVANLVRQHGVAARTRRKLRCTTDSNHGRHVAQDATGRRVEPGAADRARTADITDVATAEGRLYLAAVEDFYSRKFVGWPLGERLNSWLVVDALEMAASRRRPGEGMVAHSDRGSQSAGKHYRGLLAARGITCSMSRRANCWDNVPMESFFSSLNKELDHGERYATRGEARASIFESIEVFDNRTRRPPFVGKFNEIVESCR